MDWTQRLNAQAAPPGCGARVLRWHYSPNLADNVPHRHTFYEICLVGRVGRARWQSGGHEQEIGAGDLLLARPGAIHQISQTRDLELFWVGFGLPGGERAPLSAEIAGLWRAFEESNLTLAHDSGWLLNLWLALQQLAAGEEIGGKSAQIEALQGALLLGIAQLGAGGLAPGGIAPQSDEHGSARLAARYLQDNLGRKIALSEVAAHVHLSPRHLSRVFAHFAGVSPAAYLETARLDHARELLLGSNRPIKEIAALVGFSDVHYFTRLFCKRLGAPPAQFRRDATGVAAESDVHILHKDGALV